MRNVVISGTGSYLPSEIVTNKTLEESAPTSAEWVENVLGIYERRRMCSSETPSDMAYKASVEAMEMANLKPEDIDIIIVGTITPDRIVPSTGTILQRKLGATKAVAFDVNAACAGYIFSTIIAKQFLKNEYFNHALIVGVDAMSFLTDYEDRTCVFYGDGAGATILSGKKSSNGILSTYFRSDGQSNETVTVPNGMAEKPLCEDSIKERNHYLLMRGNDVGRNAIDIIPHAIEEAAKRADVDLDDIKYLIPHQPNLTLLKKCADKLNIPEEKVVITLDKYANMSSANVPIALDHAYRNGKLQDGDVLSMVTIGAGWTWASMMVKWGV